MHWLFILADYTFPGVDPCGEEFSFSPAGDVNNYLTICKY